MISLVGTEKQVKWAEDIRNNNISILKNEIDFISSRIERECQNGKNSEWKARLEGMIETINKAIAEIETKQPSAKWWIEHQGVAKVLIQKLHSKIK